MSDKDFLLFLTLCYLAWHAMVVGPASCALSCAYTQTDKSCSEHRMAQPESLKLKK